WMWPNLFRDDHNDTCSCEFCIGLLRYQLENTARLSSRGFWRPGVDIEHEEAGCWARLVPDVLDFVVDADGTTNKGKSNSIDVGTGEGFQQDVPSWQRR